MNRTPEVESLAIGQKWIVKDHENSGYLQIFSIYSKGRKTVVRLTSLNNIGEIIVKDLSLLIKQYSLIEQAKDNLKNHFAYSENVKRAKEYFANIKMVEDHHFSRVFKYINKLDNAEFIEKIRHFCKWERKFEDFNFKVNHCETSSFVMCTLYKIFSKYGTSITHREDFCSGKYVYKGVTMSLFVGQGAFYKIEIKEERIH